MHRTSYTNQNKCKPSWGTMNRTKEIDLKFGRNCMHACLQKLSPTAAGVLIFSQDGS